MPYPTIDAPYGLIPVNLLGSQVNTNGTREYPIQFAYATDIFFGDFVQLSRGFVTRAAVAAGTGLNQTVGIFLGCSFTNPVTRQKVFSQNWPANTLAGDAVAIVADDPDLVFKAAVCSSGTTIASAAFAMIGQNISAINNASGNLLNGNSRNAVLAPTATPVTTTLPLRVIDVVRETAVSLGSATWSAGTSTLTVSALPSALPVGTDVAVLATNGQLARTGSFVITAASAGATSVALNAAPNFGALGTGNYGTTVAFTQYPEVLVKLQFGTHGYYSATGIA
jgi:hypothetical protein